MHKHILSFVVVVFIVPMFYSDSSYAHNHSTSRCPSFDRDEWNFTISAQIRGRIKQGFYTKKIVGEPKCDLLHADHIVSLNEAHILGGCFWSPLEKKNFVTDFDNLVPACSNINSSKGESLPADFLRKSYDGKGLDYDFAAGRWCEYLRRYANVKKKYGLSFENNDADLFRECGVFIKN